MRKKLITLMLGILLVPLLVTGCGKSSDKNLKNSFEIEQSEENEQDIEENEEAQNKKFDGKKISINGEETTVFTASADVNKDGINDNIQLLESASLNESQGLNSGDRVIYLYGGFEKELLTTFDVSLKCDRFEGYEDINNDGVKDIIVSQNYEDGNKTIAVYISNNGSYREELIAAPSDVVTISCTGDFTITINDSVLNKSFVKTIPEENRAQYINITHYDNGDPIENTFTIIPGNCNFSDLDGDGIKEFILNYKVIAPYPFEFAKAYKGMTDYLQAYDILEEISE